MWKNAFLFPGQGSQEVGMGQDLFDCHDPFFSSLVELGSEITDCDLKNLCLNGSNTSLMNPRYLQPLLVAVSLGYFRKLNEHGIEPDVVLGHSLGEITSLAASEIVTPSDAVRIAAKRGELMDMVAQKIQGGMMAIMFMDLDDVVKLLDEINESNRVVIANDNAPCQVVLSGEVKILEKIASEIQNRQLGKSRMVNVTGPWHSPFLDEARNIYKEWAENINFNVPKIPVVFNALAKPHDNSQTIKDLVAGQLALPVFWRESMETLREFGVNTFYEVGPGRVLSGLVRANGFKKGNAVYNINCIKSIDSL